MHFKLGLHLFSQKSVLNIMLIILIAISLLMVNICLGMFNEQTSLLDTVQGFDKENDYYFMYTKDFTLFGGSSETFTEQSLIDAIDNDNLHISTVYTGQYELHIEQAFNTWLATFQIHPILRF